MTIKTQEACWECIKIFPRLGEPYASPDLADLYALQLSLLYPAGRSPVWLWIKWCLCYEFFLPRLENCSLNQNKWKKNYSQKKEHFCKCLIGLIMIILACSNLNTTRMIHPGLWRSNWATIWICYFSQAESQEMISPTCCSHSDYPTFSKCRPNCAKIALSSIIYNIHR